MKINDIIHEGIMDTIKGAAKEFTRDSLQRKIKQAWENTFWPRHVEPALNRIQINGRPFRKMVLGEPRMIENDRSQRAILKQYTVDIVFPIDPAQWANDEIQYLEGQLQDIQDGEWNPKVHGLGLVSFDQPMKSFQYTRGETPDLVIPVRITSLDINRGLVGEQGVAEGSDKPKPMVCKNCGKKQGEHRRDECPRGTKTAIGYTDYGPAKFEPKQKKGVSEGLPQTLRKVVPGYAKREIDRKMDAGKFGKTDADKDANFYRYKKIQDKIKEQDVQEGQDNTIYQVSRAMMDNNPGKSYLQASENDILRDAARELLRMGMSDIRVRAIMRDPDFAGELIDTLRGPIKDVQEGINFYDRFGHDIMPQDRKKKPQSKGKGEGSWHISPSGVKTNMPPTDDDYDINYGRNGQVAKFRREQGIDVRTGSRRVKKD